MTTYAKFWKRETDGALTARPVVFECNDAQGKEALNSIGSGKVVLSQYDHFSRTSSVPGGVSPRVHDGDICVCWCDSVTGTPQHVAIFVVDNRHYRGADYEVSGSDMLRELQDFITVGNIGFGTEITTTMRSIGQRCEDPHCDTKIELEAAYTLRVYTTQDVTRAGKYGILLTARSTAQETDEVMITFPDGTSFVSTIKAVSDERRYIELENALPKELPAGYKLSVSSRRIRVDNGTFLIGGQPFRYLAQPDESGSKPGVSTGVAIISRVERLDSERFDYIYTADPIQANILRDSPLTQYQYKTPTASDVEMLFSTSTRGEWTVQRSDGALNAVAYEVGDETVWDTLQSLADISGYLFRYRLPQWTAGETQFKPVRVIDYWNPNADSEVYLESRPSPSGISIIADLGRLQAGYAEALTVESVSTTEVVTHLVPKGGGGLQFHHVPGVRIASILANYPDLDWGIIGQNSYVFNRSLNIHPVWQTETFSDISPVATPAGDGRRDAAEQLLHAACGWLMAHETSDTTYRIRVYTLSNPRPGDLVSLQWTGETPTDVIIESYLSITEVEHQISGEGDMAGLRTTTLILNKTGRYYRQGADRMASELLALRRSMKGLSSASNTGSGGGGFSVVSQRGAIVLRSEMDGVSLTAPNGAVSLSGAQVDINAPTIINGELGVTAGIVFQTNGGDELRQDVIVLRGIPRPIYYTGDEDGEG